MARHTSGETVTVTRRGAPIPGEYDVQGTPVLGPTSTFEIEDVAVEPTGTDESPEAMGVWVITGFKLYLPYGADLLDTDRITIRDIPGWHVEGDSMVTGWRNPFDGKGRGSVISVRRAS